MGNESRILKDLTTLLGDATAGKETVSPPAAAAQTRHTGPYQALGASLKKQVAQHGRDILKDMAALAELLNGDGCAPTVVDQLVLFIRSSNITDYIPQSETGIRLTDVNNILSCAQEHSGLTATVIKELTVAVLYALSLPTTLTRTYIPAQKGYKVTDAVFESSAEYDRIIREADTAFRDKNEAAMKLLLPRLNRMADNGCADAQYAKGMCYFSGFVTEKDDDEAVRYFEMAGRNGSIMAYGALGDYYFDAAVPNYTKAFEYYTMLGAAATTSERRQKLRIILAEKVLNNKVMTANCLLTAALIIFQVLLAMGRFSAYGATHLVWPVIAIVLSLLSLAVSFLSFIRLRYNGIQWATPLLFSLAMLCTFFAL